MSASQSTIALLAPGGMGSKIALRLSQTSGGTILTNLEGRSETTRQRAAESGMMHASYADIIAKADYIFSVVPPKDAFDVAQQIVSAAKESEKGKEKRNYLR
ncbi:hypothetical protein VNI00_000485 [Paramarasmius palmivorus]|uniref:Pyrroline-5-carboxylate reductase catalytic N-terminal domain-containing protein n=1 Tax=Paramarasmius palmivorus TaxID=297713 RepID=A0AAW0E6D0_9AGAR